MTKINKKLFKLALEGSTGTQRDLSKRLNVTDGAIHHYLEKHEDMKDLMNQKRLDNVDKAEHEIFSQLEFFDYEKEPATAAKVRAKAAELILKSLGKAKGWVEKQELDVSGNLPVTINLIERSMDEIKRDKLTNKSETERDS